MKISSRIALAFVAGVLAAAGNFIAASPSQGVTPPTELFPSCLRAPVGDGQIRIWMNSGTLYSPTMAQADGVELDRRRDGTFIGVIDKPMKDMHNWVLFDFNNESSDVWAKCKKIQP